MGRLPCCSKEGVQRGPWSTKEDKLLTAYIQAHGEGQWRSLPKRAGLLRCGKSCRLRWLNYLRPGIKRGNITPQEEDLIIRLQSLLGNRWSLIAGRLPGRTDNEIKNHWNTHILKRLKEQGIQPKSNNHNSKLTTKEPERKTKSTATKERKVLMKKHNDSDNDPEKEEKDEVTVDKVLYFPKPIRVSARRFTVSSNSPVVSTTGTDDSLGSVGSSSQQQQQEEVDKEAETNPSCYSPWSSFDLGNEASYLHDQSIDNLSNYEDQTFLVDHNDFSLQDDTLLKKVYDEYLQLL